MARLGRRSFSRLVAVMPLVPGIDTSMTTTSRSSRTGRLIASAPSLTSSTTWKSGSRSMSSLNPCRTVSTIVDQQDAHSPGQRQLPSIGVQASALHSVDRRPARFDRHPHLRLAIDPWAKCKLRTSPAVGWTTWSGLQDRMKVASSARWEQLEL